MTPRAGDERFQAELGERVRGARAARSLSTRELARLAGVSQGLLSNVENGRAQPSMRSLYAIAEALGIGAGQLIPGIARAEVREGAVEPSDEEDVDAPVTMRLLHATPSSRVETYLITQRARYRDPKAYRHSGEDVIFVIEGRVTLNYGATRLRLAAGDTVWLDGATPHAFSTPRSSGVVALIVTRYQHTFGSGRTGTIHQAARTDHE